MTVALGIDVGLSGARAAVVDGAGRVLGTGRAPHRVELTADRAEAAPATLRRAALAAGGAAVAAAGIAAAEAVAVSALGAAPILVDADGEAVGPALLFGLDRRAERERERLGVTHDHALPKLLWWAEHEPQRLRRASTALDAGGYVVAGLCGTPVMDSITAEAYAVDGVAPPLPLPTAQDPLAIVGGLVPGAAAALGLAPGTPVIAGTFDSYADVAGTGAPLGDGCLILGTTLIAYALWPTRVAVPGLEVQRYPGAGLLLGGAAVCGGATIRWVEELLGDGGDAVALHRLEPGAGGLLALPYLAGERTPVNDPRASGAVLGLTYASTADELRRAFVDAVALSALDHVERLRRAGVDPARWRATGGATQHVALLHACCDAIGRPLDVMPDVGAAIGPASLALRAVGVDWRPVPARTLEPDPGRNERLAVLLGAYRGAYAALAPTMHALADAR